MSQKYSGDITIIPEIGYADFLKVLSNPTQGNVADAIVRGERATWPSKARKRRNRSTDASFLEMSIIKNHLQIELTIDAIIYRLRLRQIQEIHDAEDRRPVLENRSSSQIHLSRVIEDDGPETVEEEMEEEVIVRGTKSTPSPSGSSTTTTVVRERRQQTLERQSTRRGLSMTRPE